MRVSRSEYYARLNQPAKFRIQAVNEKLRKESFEVGRDKTIRLMNKLDLQVKQRITYKITTMRKHSHSVADNIVDQQFNPDQAN
tara:strand:+ start:779 stop:1030 length:252 start_codon:yes stop_codon:yes gene_type:complete